MFKTCLITGAAGFVGSNLIRKLLEEKFAEKFIVIDALKTGSNRLWMEELAGKNVFFYKSDLAKEQIYNQLQMQGADDIEVILNLAAESHVDRSIDNGVPFFMSNVIGTVRLLEFAKDLLNLKLFLNFCTDEVMGQRTEDQGPYRPYDRKMVRNPYSASKSGQEEAGFAYAITHGVPVITTRATNIYGPRQFPEKFLPVIITKLMNGEKIPLYGEGHQEREWLFVDDVCDAVLLLCKKVLEEDFMFDASDAHYNIFHIAGEKTYPNIDFMKLVIRTFFEVRDGKSFEENADYNEFFKFVEDRKAHDFRYDLDAYNMKMLGWDAKTPLHQGLEKTIKWYLDFYKEYPNGWN